MDRNTYYACKAAENLTQILEEIGSSKLTRKVGRYFNSYFDEFSDFVVNTHERAPIKFRFRFHLRLKKEFEERLWSDILLPVKIKTHMISVITAHFRDVGRYWKYPGFSYTSRKSIRRLRLGIQKDK